MGRASIIRLEQQAPWKDAEDWALVDRAKDFTVGAGDQTRTFWSALASAVPELSGRTSSECQARLQELKGSDQAVPSTGCAPTVLEDWQRQPDGRYTGRLPGESSFVWLTVAREGRLTDDPSPQPGWVVGVDGVVYELSRAAAAAGAAAVAVSGSAPAGTSGPGSVTAAAVDGGGEMLGVPTPVAALAASVLLAGGLGFGLAGGFNPPPPPPAPPVQQITKVTKVIVSPGATVSKSLAARAGGGAEQTAAAPKREAAPMLLSEQRQRAETKLERDKAALQLLGAKIREDENRVGELKRLEAERGGGATAVTLKVLPPTGPANIFPQ